MYTRKKSIVLIDDDAGIVMTVGDRLRNEGYLVTACYTVEEGLRKLPQVKPDVVVLDISMPGMNGVTFLKQLAATSTPRIPVIVFTAIANPEERLKGCVYESLVLKASDPEELLRAVRGVLDKAGSPATPPPA